MPEKLPPEPDPMPWYQPESVVRVTVPHDVYFNLSKTQKILGEVLARMGCAHCCSGHDIRFELERSFIVDSQMNIRSGRVV